MKTLYITDLDGTLLNNSAELSDKTSLVVFLSVLENDVHVHVNALEYASVFPLALQSDDHVLLDRALQNCQSLSHISAS